MSDIKSCTEGISWRLRASQPIPIIGCLGDIKNIRYVIQTFGGERRKTVNYRATTQLLESKDFIGLNPQAEFETANYTASTWVTPDGEVVFTGQEKKIVEYVDESEIPGVDGLVL